MKTGTLVNAHRNLCRQFRSFNTTSRDAPICWQSRLSGWRRRKQLRIHPSASRSYATTLQEILRESPLSYEESESFRDRLQSWQEEYGDTITDPLTLDNESRNLQKFIGQAHDDDFSPEAQDFTSEPWIDALGEEAANMLSLQYLNPGSLVEIAPRYAMQDPIFAVHLRASSTKNMDWLVSMSGRLIHTQSKVIRWGTPNWVDPVLLQPILPYLPSQTQDTFTKSDVKAYVYGIPGHLTKPIITILEKFRTETNDIYRTHAVNLDAAHEILADKVELQFGSITKIAASLFGDSGQPLTPAALYAVRKALLRDPIGFKALRRGERRAQLWQVKPMRLVHQLKNTKSWVRQYREAITVDSKEHPQKAVRLKASQEFQTVHGFLEHVRRLILLSRSERPFTEIGLAPHPPVERCSIARRERVKFNPEEIALISLIENWCLRRGLAQDPSFQSIPPFLISQTGLYGNSDPNEQTGHLFLQEIGCLSPGANSDLWNSDVMLPGYGISDRLDKAYAASQEPKNSPKLEDTCQSIRRDWGSLPVYCIDGRGTIEVDDGLSVEPASGAQEEYWVRVHVANPTAFVIPNSTLSSLARQLSSTLYTPDKRIPMLPTHINDMCSLKSGAPTMTISFRVTSAGDILEYDVCLGQIHNVIHVDYETADTILNNKPNSGFNKQTVGAIGTPRVQFEDTVFSEEQKHKIDKDLKVLQKLAVALARIRFNNGAMNVLLGIPEPSVEISHPLADNTRTPVPHIFDRTRSHYFRGDPAITLSTQELRPRHFFTQAEIPARSIVEEMMITANTACARWAWDRKLPVSYRGQLSRLTKEEVMSAQQNILHSLQFEKPREDLNWADALEHFKWRAAYTMTFDNHRPSTFHTMGVDAYIKATSPLRRYSDMMVHWQIQAALVYEHSKGKGRLITSNPNGLHEGLLPFTKATMEEMTMRVGDRIFNMLTVSKRSDLFWAAQFYYRAFYFNQANLPETFRVLIHGVRWAKTVDDKAGIAVKDIATGLPMWMLRDPVMHAEDESISMMDIWECNLDGVNTLDRTIRLKPIRLVERLDESLTQAYKAFVIKLDQTPVHLPEGMT